jgi:DNA-binding Lrp family transcriptional regulator
MAQAFVLVKLGGEPEAVAETVRAVDGVTEAHVVAGEYDVIVETTADSVRRLMRAANEIRSLGGVADTKTYICLE